MLYRSLNKLCFLAAFLLLSLTSHASVEEKKILVLGDSISAAYGMSLEQGWVALLQNRLRAENTHIVVINASISGETSAGGMRRLPDLLAKHHPSLVLLQLGGNDGLRGYPIGSLRQNLSKITLTAKAAGASVILMPMEIPPNYGQRYTTEFRESYQQVARETSSLLAPFILEQFATDEKMMQADGIHPVPAAQPLMLESAYPTIIEALELP
jgi:acyl-CoA thioesterase I